MKQREAEEILKMGHNLLITGPAGCGKTFLLNKYIGYLNKKNINVGVTASTGIAATHLDGRTIHSWCNMGIKEKMTTDQMKKLMENEHLWHRIRYTNILIIDEISMLCANRLDLADKICKLIRKDARPFGGMQIILCGDFFQLPPVAKNGEDDRFITEADVWKEMEVQICYIEEQFRQGDENFLRVLNDIRANKVTQDTYSILQTRLNKSVGTNIRPTKLHTHNKDVDAYNIFELSKLPDEERIYQMQSEGVPHLIKELKRGCLAYEILRLKIGAVVMFIRNNFDRQYVNGTLGIVIDFDEDSDYPVVETVSGDMIIAYPESWEIEDDGKIMASIKQVPLRLAWAITVHKSQGMSLDYAEIDLSKTFEYGMGYVALSRVRSLTGIKLIGINELALKVNQDAVKLDKELYLRSKKDLEKFAKLKKREIKKIQNGFLKAHKGSDDQIVEDIPF